MAGNFFRGTTVDQDGRWGKSDEKMMAKMQKAGKFAAILDTKIDMKKVNIDIISKWVSEKTIEVLGFEDEIVINLVINMLQSENLHGKKMQLDVTGFLEKKAGAFVEELWILLVDAQSQPNGIPEAFIRKKKEEILKRQQAILMISRAAMEIGDGAVVEQKSGTTSAVNEPHILSSAILADPAANDGEPTTREVPKAETDESQDDSAGISKSNLGGSRRDHDHPRSERNSRDDHKSSRDDRKHRRSRSRSPERRARGSDHKEGRHRDRDSRDSGRNRDRDRDKDRDSSRDRQRHSHRDRDRDRDRDRSRERRRSRTDDKDDDRKRRDDRDSTRESRRRETSNSSDNHRHRRRESERGERRHDDDGERRKRSLSGREDSRHSPEGRSSKRSSSPSRKSRNKSAEECIRSDSIDAEKPPSADIDVSDTQERTSSNEPIKEVTDTLSSTLDIPSSKIGDAESSDILNEKQLREVALASFRARRNSESA